MAPEKPEGDPLEQSLRDLSLRVEKIERQLEALSTASVGVPVPPPTPPVQPHTSRNPLPEPSPARDIESRIGAQWLNRVGIIAVLVGVSFFLKYAFESEWIGAGGRVLIGLIAGVALIVWSEWFRLHQYRIFSFSLKALGLGILYLALWAAFQVYALISWMLAFGGMVAITASTAALSLSQDAEVLALFALVGGFATPVLLYTGENRALELFAYLTLLNAATLFLAAFRAWRRLLLFSLVATFCLFLLWFGILYEPNERNLALAFTTAYFAIFAGAPLLESRTDRSHASTMATAALNALGYFLELYLLLGRTNTTSAACCTVALAGVYFALANTLRQKSAARSTSLEYLHLALSTVFITLAIAIYFESYWISMAWFLEAAVLMVLGFGRRSAFVRWQALGLIALTIAKVFVLDIWRLDRGYRILSFVLLGMLLLAVSFLYQRDWLKLSGGAHVQKN